MLFYEKGDFETPVYKINSPKVEGFSLSPGSVCHALCYMPGNYFGDDMFLIFDVFFIFRLVRVIENGSDSN